MVGVAGVVGSVGWFIAFTIQNAAYVRALGQIELVFMFITSVFIFKEKSNAMEVIGILGINRGYFDPAVGKISKNFRPRTSFRAGASPAKSSSKFPGQSGLSAAMIVTAVEPPKESARNRRAKCDRLHADKRGYQAHDAPAHLGVRFGKDQRALPDGKSRMSKACKKQDQ